LGRLTPPAPGRRPKVQETRRREGEKELSADFEEEASPKIEGTLGEVSEENGCRGPSEGGRKRRNMHLVIGREGKLSTINDNKLTTRRTPGYVLVRLALNVGGRTIKIRGYGGGKTKTVSESIKHIRPGSKMRFQTPGKKTRGRVRDRHSYRMREGKGRLIISEKSKACSPITP